MGMLTYMSERLHAPQHAHYIRGIAHGKLVQPAMAQPKLGCLSLGLVRRVLRRVGEMINPLNCSSASQVPGIFSENYSRCVR